MKTALLFFVTMAIASTINAMKDVVSGFQEERDSVDDEGALRLLASDTCPYGGGVVLFNMEVTIIPGNGAFGCNQAALDSIGEMITTVFVNAGLSAMPGTTIVSDFCSLPLLPGIRRSLQTTTGFVWKGGGGCKGCNPDNRDGRKLLTITIKPTAAPTRQPSAKPTSSSLFGSIFTTPKPTISAAPQQPAPQPSPLLTSLLAPQPQPSTRPTSLPSPQPSTPPTPPPATQPSTPPTLPPTSQPSTPPTSLLAPQPSLLSSLLAPQPLPLLGTLGPAQTAQNLFTSLFVSKTDAIEAEVDAKVTAGLVNFTCMGSNPQVTVHIEIVESKSDLQCIIDALLGLLSV